MKKTIIDLTYLIHEGMTTFPRPWHPWVEITHLGRHGIEGRETKKIIIGTHTGTHCDAPRHFIADGDTLDMCPLETLIGPAVLVDFSKNISNKEIGVRELQNTVGEKPAEEFFSFGWQRHWGNMEFYMNHPYLSIEAAEWLVSKGVKLVGMDTAMPDNPDPVVNEKSDSPIHKLLLKNRIIIVEYLCNLDLIKQREFELIVLPLKVKDSDGCPVRCVAIVS